MDVEVSYLGKVKENETEKTAAFESDVLDAVADWRKRQPGKVPTVKQAINGLLRQALVLFATVSAGAIDQKHRSNGLRLYHTHRW